MIEVVSATRLSESDFWGRSALGLSLKRLSSDKRLVPVVAFANQRGLPDVFNERIRATSAHEYLVFIHDDVWLDDCFLADRVLDGLRVFDVIGVAGNRRRVRQQPAWLFAGRNAQGRFVWDKAYLSGAIGHGKGPFGAISAFGPAPAACEFVDGVFLAVRRSVLQEAGVGFDPLFKFHFYDMDFCRSVRAAGLRLGTWTIAMTHQSGGAFGAAAWNEAFVCYQKKWPD